MDQSIKIGLLTIIAASALAGCAEISDPAIGKGPISLSTNAEKAFADYQAQRTPRYFAISADGQYYYYSFCPDGRCRRQAKTVVIDRCEAYSNGIPCKIYGSQGVVVWTDES